jgi:hypothetical protein
MVTESPPRAAPRRVRVTRVGVALAAAIGLLFAYYAWTASSSGNPLTKVNPFNFRYGDSDYYNLQADAFLHGHLWLDVPVDPKIGGAVNPYALALDQWDYGVVDGSYYDGRWYLSWGPAPAVTTFLPARMLGTRIQENLACTLYAFIGVLLGGLALARLVRHLVPGVSRRVVWAGNAALALATALPWILRTPRVYEAAITAAFCFCMAGFFLLTRELLRDDGPRGRRVMAAGVFYGLGILSRPSVVVVVGAMVLVVWALRGTRPSRRVLSCLLGPPMVAGVAFMLYNAARFSGPLDFGNRWQLSGRDVRHIAYNDAGNLPPTLYGYLVAPLRWTLEFPYVHLPPPPAPPLALTNGFGAENTASVLWAAPFTLLAGVLLVWRRGASQKVIAVVGALVGVALVVLLLGAFAVPGYTERYELDFLPYLVMAATLAWAELIRRASTSRAAMRWRRTGLILAAYSVMIGVAISFTGYYDSLKLFDLPAYQRLERAFSPLPTVVTMVAGEPRIAGIAVKAVDSGYDLPHENYRTISADGASFALFGDDTTVSLAIVSPGGRDGTLRFTLGRSPGTYGISQTGGADGSTSTVVQGGSAGALPLRLRRGINYVELALSPGPDVPALAGGSVAGIELHDVRVG